MVELYSLFFMLEGAADVCVGGVGRGQNPHLKEPLLSFPSLSERIFILPRDCPLCALTVIANGSFLSIRPRVFEPFREGFCLIIC